MKKTAVILLIAIGIASCSDSGSEPQLLNGILTGSFVEVSPEKNRTILIFSSKDNQLLEKRSSEGENAISRTFSIRKLDDNRIELNRNEADEVSPRGFHYLIVANNKFELGNINENDPRETLMIFERN